MPRARLVPVTRYVSLVGCGLLTGGALTALVLELALRPLGAAAYIQVRQLEHHWFPWFIGVMLVPTLAAIVGLVVLARRARSPALLPAAAALILILAALVVSFAVNVPINLAQLSWNPHSPPANWAAVRDRWQIAHAIRTFLFVLALRCLSTAVIGRPFGRAAR